MSEPALLHVERFPGALERAVEEINALGWADRVVGVQQLEHGSVTAVVLRVDRIWLINHGRN